MGRRRRAGSPGRRPRAHPVVQMRPRRPQALNAYLAAISVAGLGVLGAVLALRVSVDLETVGLEVTVLSALVVAGEVFPIRLPHGEGEFTTSTTFAYALLLVAGLAPAALALALGSAITDGLRSRSLPKLAFNAGQYTLSLA